MAKTSPKPKPKEPVIVDGEVVPAYETSKAVRAAHAAKREGVRLITDERFNDERDGELIPRADVEALLAEIAISLRAGINQAHTAAVATLPLTHQPGMAAALRRETSAVWEILAASAAKLPEAAPTKEKQGEGRAKKAERRARVTTAGSGKSTSARSKA